MEKIRNFLIIIVVGSIFGSIALLCGCSIKHQPIYYNLIYIAGEGGYIDGQAEQQVESGKDGLTVVAVPYDGYEFVQWSDGGTEAARQDKNVNSDMRFAAEFKAITPVIPAPKEYTLIYKASAGGYIEGETHQTIKRNENAEKVIAVPEEGYEFVRWSDGLKTAERQDGNIKANDTITAIFDKKTFIVRYERNKGGMMRVTTADGKKYGGVYIDFEVKYGEDCEKIIAVETFFDENQKFLSWADGVETEERQERNVTSDITIKAKFGYELKYTVASGKGSIIGNTVQIIEKGEWSESVEAVAAEGYVFSGWSDMTMDTTHKLTYTLEKSQEYVVYFEPIERTFKYDYGTATPLKAEITVNRNKLNESVFEIPQRADYIFRGWYADSGYKLKVVHESGKLMLGLQTLNLETDTLYARWEKIGEEKKTYKILMVMIDEINLTLDSKRIEEIDEEGYIVSISKKPVLLDYKMRGVERKLCSVIPSKISYYLNKWFEGRVIFEVDTYFTRETIKDEDTFDCGVLSTGLFAYNIFGDDIAEIKDIVDEYECTLTTHSFDDYNSLLHAMSTAGIAGPVHGSIHLESKLFKNFPNQLVIEETINYNGNGAVGDGNSRGLTTIETYIHEFIHTIEMRYKDIYEFHACFLPENYFEGDRLYLLHQFIKDGEYVGIPTSYWEAFYN